MDAIRINKHDSKVLKWLQSAASKDTAREAIMGINSNGNYAAVDGWRLHAVPGNGYIGIRRSLGWIRSHRPDSRPDTHHARRRKTPASTKGSPRWLHEWHHPPGWDCKPSGRKSHRVVTESGTMYSVRCEAVFNEHPHVFRSALVGVGPRGRQRPVIVVEPVAGRRPLRAEPKGFREELLKLGCANEMTRPIRDVLFHRGFPVDIRHNAKIDREALAQWAAGRLR